MTDTPHWLLALTYMPARRWMLPEEVAESIQILGNDRDEVRNQLRKAVNRGGLICRRHERDRRRWEFRKPLPRFER